METIYLELGERSYPIIIGEGLLQQKGVMDNFIRGNQVLIVTNETIAPILLERVSQLIGAPRIETLILPDGEQHKNFQTLNLIFDHLLAKHFDRGCCLIALGGGVVGDMVGFAAACYQRGVDFIQVPTTLLSQVDSSVGGKTAVNHPRGKNMIGAFHQPRQVVIDIETLSTLPDREFSAGMAEVIKYGLIRDAEFFSWLEKNVALLKRKNPSALIHAIKVSCETKATIVAADERESGQRALLNLGHTFGHAIETFTEYKTWLHGEAIAVGMLMAGDLSARLGWIDDGVLRRMTDIFSQFSLPTAVPQGMTADHFMQLMAHDKKVRDGQIRLVLMKALGEAMTSGDYNQKMLQETLNQFCGRTKSSC